MANRQRRRAQIFPFPSPDSRPEVAGTVPSAIECETLPRGTSRRDPRATVLVVEDEVNVSDPIQDLLERDGHCCLTARDVEEAEWILQVANVRALAVDMGAPGRNPLEWLEALFLTRPPLTRRTVTITERHLETKEALRIQACGAIILQKPFHIQELRDAILQATFPATGHAPPPLKNNL